MKELDTLPLHVKVQIHKFNGSDEKFHKKALGKKTFIG